jgi:predicted nucleotidyltransferase
MAVKDILSHRRDEILRIAARHGASNIRVFGSVARGEAGPESDIDLLVDLERGRSLLDHAALKVDLEQLLERPVDVATERGLKPRIREHILREAIPL